MESQQFDTIVLFQNLATKQKWILIWILIEQACFELMNWRDFDTSMVFLESEEEFEAKRINFLLDCTLYIPTYLYKYS